MSTRLLVKIKNRKSHLNCFKLRWDFQTLSTVCAKLRFAPISIALIILEILLSIFLKQKQKTVKPEIFKCSPNCKFLFPTNWNFCSIIFYFNLPLLSPYVYYFSYLHYKQLLIPLPYYYFPKYIP